MDKKLIHDVAVMAKQAAELTQELLTENTELKKQAADNGAALEEMKKQASTDSAETAVVGLSDDARERAVDHIISAGQAKEASRDELLKDLADNPDKLVDYVEKLATADAPQPVKRLGKIVSEAPNTGSGSASEDYWKNRVIRR